MLWGYFILFYISGGKNWFLVWSNAFQVITSLPQLLPLRVEPRWEAEEWVVGSSFPSSHEATLGQIHKSQPPALRDRHPPIGALLFWAICLILDRLPHLSEPQSP